MLKSVFQILKRFENLQNIFAHNSFSPAFFQAVKVIKANHKGKYTPVFLLDHSPIHRLINIQFVYFKNVLHTFYFSVQKLKTV